LDKIITARRGSPIVIGVGDGETIIASDAAAILAHTQRVIYLDDNDIAIVSADAIDIRDLHNIPVTREIAELGDDAGAAEKGGFEHFMLKEIHEQPDALANAIRGRLDSNLGSSVLAGMGTSPRELAGRYAGNDHAFFIGRGPMYPVALEGALKLKEISYIHAEGYHAAELKHGPIALLVEGTPVIALACDIPGKDKTMGNIEECRSRGARILGLVTEGDHEAAERMDDSIPIPRCHPLVATIPAVVALQLFSYHVARVRGCEIDQPRNLAKSVTVE
jgi:glucosamine--fructose-6-phosphate aminotransferase (isomerizing)